MSEKSNALIIDPQLLADIQRQCRERAAELEAALELPRTPGAPERRQKVFAMAEVPPPISQAERFAAAIEQMPPKVRAFFEHEDLVSPRPGCSGTI